MPSASESTAAESADTAVSDDSSTDASPAEETADYTEIETDTSGLTGVGYYTDDVDHFSRDAYKIAYIDISLTNFAELTCQVWTELGEYLNYEFTYFNANSDEDYYVSTIEDLANQGYNGLILNGDATDCVRHQEVADEVGINWLPFMSTYVYDDGVTPSHPSAVMDSAAAGAAALDWSVENFEAYNGYEPDWANIGVITVTLSVSADIQRRIDGFYAEYSALFPELAETNYFAGDTLPGGLSAWVSAQGGYDQVAAIVAANPQFEGWLVFGGIENYASGAQTLLTEYGLDTSSIVTAISASMMMDEYDQCIMTCWRASFDTPQQEWGSFIMHGLIALIDGRATPETLWEDYKEDGDTYATVHLPFTTVTYDMYTEYQDYLGSYMADNYA